MERRGPVAWLLCLALLAPLWGCPSGPPARKPGPIRVVATIPPLAGLSRPLLPAGATVQTLIPPNRSEHGYELTADDIAALASADVVVYVGLGLDAQVESFLKKHPNTGRRDVCFASVAGIAQAGAADDHDGAAHDADHDDDGHHHGGVDPHLWLDPDLCITLIPALQRAIDSAPGSSAARADALIAQIKAFDAESKSRLAPFKDAAIVTHHSAWGRFAAHYGMKVAAVIRPVETGEETPQAAEAAVKAVREQGARAIFIEPQFSPVVAQNIAEKTGVRVGHLDPLGDGDWFKMMRANVDALVEALGH